MKTALEKVKSAVRRRWADFLINASIYMVTLLINHLTK